MLRVNFNALPCDWLEIAMIMNIVCDQYIFIHAEVDHKDPQVFEYYLLLFLLSFVIKNPA